MFSTPKSSSRGLLGKRWSVRGSAEERPVKDMPVAAVTQSSATISTANTKAAQNLLDFLKDSDTSLTGRVAKPTPLPTPKSPLASLVFVSIKPSVAIPFPDSSEYVVMDDFHADTLELRLQDFHSLVCCDKSIQNTQILSTELYSKWTGRVTHQFVILELHREGRPKVWAKLERTLAYLRHAITHLGIAPAFDKAVMSGEKDELIRNAKRENRQEFRSPPTLAKLSLILECIWVESLRYILWSENCYFFSSAIQQRLGAEHGGVFVHGHLQFAFLAKHTRRQIDQQVHSLLRMHYAHPLSELLYVANATMPASCLKEIVDIPERLHDVDGTDLVRGTLLVYQLCEAVYRFSVIATSDDKGETGNALVLHEATNDFLLRLSNWSEIRTPGVVHPRHSLYTLFVWKFIELLRYGGRLEQSCVTAAQNVAIARWLSLQSPWERLENLAPSLEYYATSLREAGRFAEACEPSAERVSILRLEYLNNPKMQPYRLAHSLYEHGRSLFGAGRFDEACDVRAEAVSLGRRHFADCGEVLDLATPLMSMKHLVFLRLAPRLDKASVAGAEGNSPLDGLFPHNIDTDQALSLAELLSQYGNSLRAAGRYDKACDISAEAVTLVRQFAVLGPEHCRQQRNRRLERSLAQCYDALCFGSA